MDLFSELNQLMVEYRFRPNRKMGQNFLIDEEVLEKIIKEAELSPKDKVLEIGAGTGFLTRELAKKCCVVAVELDAVLAELLEAELSGNNVDVQHADFVKMPFPECNKVVALPPYTISSAVMRRIFELKPKLCVLVFQREFVEKLLAEPGFAEYNALSVLTQYYFRAEMVSRVPPKSFFPKPNTESAILKLVAWQAYGKAKDEGFFHSFIKSIFRFKNKNFLNALKNGIAFIEKTDAERKAIIEKAEKLSIAGEKLNQIGCSELVKAFNGLF